MTDSSSNGCSYSVCTTITSDDVGTTCTASDSSSCSSTQCCATLTLTSDSTTQASSDYCVTSSDGLNQVVVVNSVQYTAMCNDPTQAICTAVDYDSDNTETQSQCSVFDNGDTTYCCAVLTSDKNGEYPTAT